MSDITIQRHQLLLGVDLKSAYSSNEGPLYVDMLILTLLIIACCHLFFNLLFVYCSNAWCIKIFQYFMTDTGAIRNYVYIYRRSK